MDQQEQLQQVQKMSTSLPHLQVATKSVTCAYTKYHFAKQEALYWACLLCLAHLPQWAHVAQGHQQHLVLETKESHPHLASLAAGDHGGSSIHRAVCIFDKVRMACRACNSIHSRCFTFLHISWSTCRFADASHNSLLLFLCEQKMH